MYALITGASSGVGKAYATILAREYKHDLLLVSNQQAELKQLADELRNQYAVKTIDYFCDLANQEAADNIHLWCEQNNIEVDILINNAGMFFWKPLIETDEAKIQAMLNLHILTPTKLCRLFGEDMCKRLSNNNKVKNGYILNMSSMTSWMSMPGIQCYNASKAYMLNFSKSLWYEFKPYQVVVTALTPGAIDTPLYGLASSTREKLVKFGISFTPERFAAIALKRMFKGKKQAMPGWVNHIAVPIISHLPDWAIFFAMRRLPQYQSMPL